MDLFNILEDFPMKLALSLFFAISAVIFLSCDKSSSSGSTGFSIDPTTLTAPSQVAVPCTTIGFAINGVDYSSATIPVISPAITRSKSFAVVYQSSTQTGFSCAVYDTENKGLEIAKLMVYVNDATPLPTSSGTANYNTLGSVVVKYAADNLGNPMNSPQKTALVKKAASGIVQFSITYVADNNYTVSVTSLPATTPIVTLTSIFLAAKAQ
jgi:hypothetical protein